MSETVDRLRQKIAEVDPADEEFLALAGSTQVESYKRTTKSGKVVDVQAHTRSVSSMSVPDLHGELSGLRSKNDTQSRNRKGQIINELRKRGVVNESNKNAAADEQNSMVSRLKAKVLGKQDDATARLETDTALREIEENDPEVKAQTQEFARKRLEQAHRTQVDEFPRRLEALDDAISALGTVENEDILMESPDLRAALGILESDPSRIRESAAAKDFLNASTTEARAQLEAARDKASDSFDTSVAELKDKFGKEYDTPESRISSKIQRLSKEQSALQNDRGSTTAVASLKKRFGGTADLSQESVLQRLTEIALAQVTEELEKASADRTRLKTSGKMQTPAPPDGGPEIEAPDFD